jgi:hypothetical protein
MDLLCWYQLICQEEQAPKRRKVKLYCRKFQGRYAMKYVDGFVLAVPAAKKETYRKHAAEAAPLFKEFGATRMVECWGDDVPDGELTDAGDGRADALRREAHDLRRLHAHP